MTEQRRASCLKAIAEAVLVLIGMLVALVVGALLFVGPVPQ